MLVQEWRQGSRGRGVEAGEWRQGDRVHKLQRRKHRLGSQPTLWWSDATYSSMAKKCTPKAQLVNTLSLLA